MTIKEKYLAWRLEHQLHFVVRVGVDLHLHRVHVLVGYAFIGVSKFVCLSATLRKKLLNRFSHNSVETWLIGHQRNHYTSVIILITWVKIRLGQGVLYISPWLGLGLRTRHTPHGRMCVTRPLFNIVTILYNVSGLGAGMCSTELTSTFIKRHRFI